MGIKSRTFRLTALVFAAGSLLSTAALTAAADPPADGTQSEPTRFLRVVEQPGQSLTLEVGAWRYRPSEGEGPTIGLISVAHIGDPVLYSRLQAILGKYDVVLYESVKPAGAGRPTGRDDDERVEATQSSIEFVAQMIAKYKERVGAWPATTADLLVGLSTIDQRLTDWTAPALVDAWGNDLLYARDADRDAFTITSLGADGATGGEGAEADLTIDGAAGLETFSLDEDDNLQQQLADALGLAFQLKAMDYSMPNWRCSDMTVDQLSRAFAARGLDFGQLGGTLAGTSFPAQLVKALLRVMRLVDTMADGMMSDMMKIVMIDTLGEVTLTEAALNNQFGAGFGEVIIGDRNQIVMDDLKGVLTNEDDVESIAIFYGAAHMPDFEDRLHEQFGYVPAEVVWVPAITVDLRDSAVSDAQIQQIRRMIRMSLQGMR